MTFPCKDIFFLAKEILTLFINQIMQLLLLSALLATQLVSSAPYDPINGQKYITSHSSTTQLDPSQHQYEGFQDKPIKEWHFHVYFFQENEQSKADALRLKSELVESVRKGDFVAVCDGVDSTMLPNLNTSYIPGVNYGPRGPHPAGSFEIWAPIEHVGAIMSYIMLHRGENSILFHPLTQHCIEDHTGRIAWIGPSFNIDRTCLSFSDDECDEAQYSELRLGYSAD
tara:strand:+ start:1134 stop:1814 length:681 start_codon:yes stop_codon:yes gene_type:complete